MIVRSLGYVKSTTPGTPKSFNALFPNLGKVHNIEFWPLLSNTGIVTIGLDVSAPGSTGVAMDKSTGLNCLKQLQVPATTGQQDNVQFEGENSNDIRVQDFAIDVAVSGDGFAVFTIEN